MIDYVGLQARQIIIFHLKNIIFDNVYIKRVVSIMKSFIFINFCFIFVKNKKIFLVLKKIQRKKKKKIVKCE